MVFDLFRGGRPWASLFRLGIGVLVGSASARTPLWTDQEWGTEGQFNPLSVVLNEGGDILQLEGRDARWGRLAPPENWRRLGSTLSKPWVVLQDAGWGNVVGSEVVPTSFAPSRAAWIPNWQLHLVGGGLIAGRLEDWYAFQGVAHPFLPALATAYLGFVLNEAVEIAGMTPRLPADPVIDLFLFDAAGMFLFRSEFVRRTVVQRVQILHWPLQPTLGLDGGTLENAGQYFALKFPLPGGDRWRGFYHFGLGNIGGLSRKVGETHSVSVGGGAYAKRIESLDATHNRVQIGPKLGVFWDREESLLASVFWNAQSREKLSLQVYPGAGTGIVAPWGGWLAWGEEGGWHGGITLRIGLGLGTSR